MENTEIRNGIITVQALRPATYSGLAVVSEIPDKLRKAYAIGISSELAANAQFMGTMEPEEIEFAMNTGGFTLVVDQGTNPWGLLGCARDVGKLEKPERHELPQVTWTVGTWLGANGNGRRALNAAADHAYARPEVNAVVALVGTSNYIGRKSAERAGGREVGTRESKKVKGAQVTVFQLRPN